MYLQGGRWTKIRESPVKLENQSEERRLLHTCKLQGGDLLSYQSDVLKGVTPKYKATGSPSWYPIVAAARTVTTNQHGRPGDGISAPTRVPSEQSPGSRAAGLHGG